MNPVTVQDVVDDLASWRSRFEAGDIKFRGLFQPKLSPGERRAGLNLRVHLVEGRGGDASDFGGAVVPKVDGAARPTSERLLLTGNGRRIVKEWRWAEVSAVMLLQRGLGVRLELRSGTTDTVGSVWHSTVPASAPDPRELLVGWLQVEAAFVASTGPDAIERWFAELPGRVAHTISS